MVVGDEGRVRVRVRVMVMVMVVIIILFLLISIIITVIMIVTVTVTRIKRRLARDARIRSRTMSIGRPVMDTILERRAISTTNRRRNSTAMKKIIVTVPGIHGKAQAHQAHGVEGKGREHEGSEGTNNE